MMPDANWTTKYSARKVVDYYDDGKSCPTIYGVPYSNPMAASALIRLMKERNSPGHAAIVRHMKEVHSAINALELNSRGFCSSKYSSRFVPDKIVKRYMYIQCYNMALDLAYVLGRIDAYLNDFDLTDENTKLPPEPDWVETWYESRRQETKRARREARRERAVERQHRARMAAKAASSSFDIGLAKKIDSAA